MGDEDGVKLSAEDAGLFIEPEVEAPVKVEPVRRLTDAEIETRRQAHLAKIRGGK